MEKNLFRLKTALQKYEYPIKKAEEAFLLSLDTTKGVIKKQSPLQTEKKMDDQEIHIIILGSK